MTIIEKNQLDYLQKKKFELLDNFIGGCEEINRQIEEVKSGEWCKQIEFQNGWKEQTS